MRVIVPSATDNLRRVPGSTGMHGIGVGVHRLSRHSISGPLRDG
jgi:hypothetical protein